jgi:DNA replication protein DnaC
VSGESIDRLLDGIGGEAVHDLRGRARDGAACPFAVCDGSGFVIDEDTNTASDCECRRARIAAARTRSLEGRIPRRYRGVSFDRPPVSDLIRTAPSQVQLVRGYVHSVDRNLDSGKGLWLWGDVGTGKTTLAMLVSKAAMDAGRSVAIYSLPRLLNLLRESLESPGGLIDLLDRLGAVDLLHIDDLGAENQTDWVLEQLYSIVNARYEAERAIIATTNLPPDELGEHLGERTVSRLVEICGDPITLAGEDRRREYRVEQPRFAARGD